MSDDNKKTPSETKPKAPTITQDLGRPVCAPPNPANCLHTPSLCGKGGCVECEGVSDK